jgi:hypothetical protein
VLRAQSTVPDEIWVWADLSAENRTLNHNGLDAGESSGVTEHSVPNRRFGAVAVVRFPSDSSVPPDSGAPDNIALTGDIENAVHSLRSHRRPAGA